MYEKPVELFIQSVNRRIAEIRTQRGITQAELAERMNVELREIQKWESHQSMTLRTIHKFSVALNCPIIDLFQKPKTNQSKRGRPKRNA